MDSISNLNDIPSESQNDNVSSRHGKDELLTLCCICGKTFSGVISLRDHFKSCHDSNLRDSSSTESNSVDVVSVNGKNITAKPYKCEYCFKGFTKSCNLRSHVKAVHKGVKSHECTVCRKFFTRNSDLQKHVDAVHKRLRPFKCKVCTRTFSQKSSLKRHLEAVHDNSRKNKNVALSTMMARVDETNEDKSVLSSMMTNGNPVTCSSDISNSSASPIDMSPTPINGDMAASNAVNGQGIDPALLVDVLRNILQRNPAALEYFKQQLSVSLLTQSFPAVTPHMPNEFEFDTPLVGGGDDNVKEGKSESVEVDVNDKTGLAERFNEPVANLPDLQQTASWMQMFLQSARPSPLDFFLQPDQR